MGTASWTGREGKEGKVAIPMRPQGSMDGSMELVVGAGEYYYGMRIFVTVLRYFAFHM
jgi:hypothetical protein